MYRITHVEARDNYSLVIEFENGIKGEINISDRLFGPVFEQLKDKELFSKVGIDDYGVVCWPNNADLAPDAIYQKLSSKTQ